MKITDLVDYTLAAVARVIWLVLLVLVAWCVWTLLR